MGKRIFKLNKWQDTFVFSDKENIALFNEFGSGKTSAGIIKMQSLMDNYPKNVGVVIRNIHDELIKATIPQYFELIFGDRYLIPDSVSYNKTNKQLIFENGSELWFTALDNPKSMRNLKNMVIGALWADQGEEINEEVWTMACGRVRLKNVPLRKFMTGNAEGGDHWAKDLYYTKPIDVQSSKIDGVPCEWGYWQGVDENHLGIMAKPKANEINLPTGYYDSLIKRFPREWVLKYVYSQWIGKTGLIYGITDENIVYDPLPFNLKDIPDHYEIAYGQDYGISDTSPMVWLTICKAKINNENHYFVIDEYYEYEQGIDEICDYVKSLNAIINNEIKFVVGCPATFQREARQGKRKGEAPVELFKTNGINIKKHPVLFEARQPIIQKIIEDGRLHIFYTCENTIKELKNYKWKNIKTANDHAIEALERTIHRFETTTEIKKEDYYKIPAGL